MPSELDFWGALQLSNSDRALPSALGNVQPGRAVVARRLSADHRRSAGPTMNMTAILTTNQGRADFEWVQDMAGGQIPAVSPEHGPTWSARARSGRAGCRLEGQRFQRFSTWAAASWRHQEGGDPEREPHEVLQLVNTPLPEPANAGSVRVLGLRSAAGAALEGAKRDGARRPGPTVAQCEACRGHQEDRYVSPSPVGQQRIEELRKDEDGEDRHDETGRDQLQQRQSAPSGPRGWVVLSELRWVPCLGSPSPVERAFGRRPDSEVPKCCLLGNAHIARNPSGALQYYV